MKQIYKSYLLLCSLILFFLLFQIIMFLFTLTNTNQSITRNQQWEIYDDDGFNIDNRFIGKEKEKQVIGEEVDEIFLKQNEYFVKSVQVLCDYLTQKDLMNMYINSGLIPFHSTQGCEEVRLIINSGDHLNFTKKRILIYVHIVSKNRLGMLKNTWFQKLKEHEKILKFYNLEIEILTWSTSVKGADYYIPELKMKDEIMKLKLILSYLYTEKSEFDWYFRADDDVYIIIRNLIPFVRILPEEEDDKPMIIGYLFTYYHLSGGAGFIYNKRTLEMHNKIKNRKCGLPYCDVYDDKFFAEKLAFYYPTYRQTFDHTGIFFFSLMTLCYKGFYFGAPSSDSNLILDYSTGNHQGFCNRPLTYLLWRGVQPLTFHKFPIEKQSIFEKYEDVPHKIFQIDLLRKEYKNLRKCEKLFSKDERFSYEQISINNKKVREMNVKESFRHNIQVMENTFVYYKLFLDGGIYLHKSFICNKRNVDRIVRAMKKTKTSRKDGFVVIDNSQNVNIIGFRKFCVSSHILFKDAFYCIRCDEKDTSYDLIKYAFDHYPEINSDTELFKYHLL